MDFDNSLDKIIPDVLEFVSFGGTALQIPSGTTAERPATPDVGATRLNTETGKVEIYNGSWTNIDNTPKITVATTSPSSPAVGDVWIDIS